MKFKYLVFNIFLFTSLIIGLKLEAQEKSLAFTGGETLTYVAKYTWGSVNTDIGEAVVSLQYVEEQGREPIFISKVNGRTFRFFDVFFKVRDYYESRFRASDITPIFFYRDISEGKYKMKNTFSFLPNNIIKSRVQRMDDPPRDSILKAKPLTFDILTLFYYSRNLPFSEKEIGVVQPVSFVIDGEIFNIYFRFLGKENKKIEGLGHHKTLKFAAKVIAGEVFNGKEEMTIWVSDDYNKVPLYFESPIIVGKVSGRLKRYSGLKYPLSSKL